MSGGSTTSSGGGLSKAELAQVYSRQQLSMGAATQVAVSQTTVLVVGVNGLGLEIGTHKTSLSPSTLLVWSDFLMMCCCSLHSQKLGSDRFRWLFGIG